MPASRTVNRPKTAPEELPLHRFKADFFTTLAHPTRIRIVELLRDGEKSAGDIVAALRLEQSNVSQHLARLREKTIVTARREGAVVFYCVRDPRLYKVLDVLRDYFYDHLNEIREMARDL
jgi:ArsR family transcriptional regulator